MITGRQIREARNSLRWSQKEFARKAMVSLSVVVRAENSPGEPLVKIVEGKALLAVLALREPTCLPTIWRPMHERTP